VRQPFHFDESRITLPKGTRVVLRTDLRAADGYLCKAGTVGRVVEVAYDSYELVSASGRRIGAQRDQIAIQRQDQLKAIAFRQRSWETLRERVIFAAVVGSQAWGLADTASDEDIKGIFALPFDAHAGLWQPPDEIADPLRDAQYWEVQKAVYQGLRADAGTLEALWSPRVKISSDLGDELLQRRRMFVSRHIFGTFGRYAMSQFRKMRASQNRLAIQRAVIALLRDQPTLAQEELVERLCRPGGLPGVSDVLFSGRSARRRAIEVIKDLYSSLHARGLLEQRGYTSLVELLAERGDALLEDEPRWKNAYNLLRLLHSGIRWLREGEPLIEVTGPLRDELLAVKRGEMPLQQILASADVLAAELERAHQSSALPEQPDFSAAHDFLLHCREVAARDYLAVRPQRDAPLRVEVTPEVSAAAPSPPRFAIPAAALQRFLDEQRRLDFVVCSLVGSHSYGFPSRDSDFDLKAIHLAPASAVLGLDRPAETESFLGLVEGLEIDFTSHEAGKALGRLVAGDGNVLERILSVYLLRPTTPTDPRLEELQALARVNISRRFHGHYAGFFRGQVQLYTKEGSRRIKPLLYMFRVALTGVHLLRSGELVADLRRLLELYRYPAVQQLFELKERAEQATVEDDAPYLALLPELERALAEARDGSSLPDEAPKREALSDWLRRWRRQADVTPDGASRRM
jgi:predicted nucleotidyltransferase